MCYVSMFDYSGIRKILLHPHNFITEMLASPQGIFAI